MLQSGPVGGPALRHLILFTEQALSPPWPLRPPVRKPWRIPALILPASHDVAVVVDGAKHQQPCDQTANPSTSLRQTRSDCGHVTHQTKPPDSLGA